MKDNEVGERIVGAAFTMKEKFLRKIRLDVSIPIFTLGEDSFEFCIFDPWDNDKAHNIRITPSEPLTSLTEEELYTMMVSEISYHLKHKNS